jgi:hypothetical protein
VFRQLLETVPLKDDEFGCHIQRSLCPSARSNVAVKVGSGEHDNQWKVRMPAGEALDRFKAPARVQRNHEITGPPIIRLLHKRAMAQLPQDADPSLGRDSVAV